MVCSTCKFSVSLLIGTVVCSKKFCTVPGKFCMG